jgi:hypothetical protein
MRASSAIAAQHRPQHQRQNKTEPKQLRQQLKKILEKISAPLAVPVPPEAAALGYRPAATAEEALALSLHLILSRWTTFRLALEQVKDAMAWDEE